MIITTAGPQNIGQVRKQFQHGNIFLSPEEYQRMGAWDLGQKQLLVDSVFRGLDIPKFYLWKIDMATLHDGYPDGDTKNYYRTLLQRKMQENDDPNPYIFEVVDGQQRIRTLLEFMGITPPNQQVYRGSWHPPFTANDDTPMARGRLYAQLNADQCIRYDESRLTIMVLENAKINEIRDMFLRLQNGTPLNSQQKRDAMGSYLGRAAGGLTELPFFTQSLPFGNDNSDHKLVSSQMLHLALKNEIVSCTSRALDKAYKFYLSNEVDPGVARNTKRTIQLLGQIFPARNHLLNRSYAMGLFWLFYRLDDQYTVPASEHDRIRQNFDKMDIARMEANEREYANVPADEVYEDLTGAMTSSRGGADGIRTVHEILGRFLFEGVNLQPRPELDPNRIFSFEEKAILFGRAQGKCQMSLPGGQQCGKSIDFEDAAVDHILPHSLQGRTELANGRIAYRLCNIARGNRDTFDPCTMCHLQPPTEPPTGATGA